MSLQQPREFSWAASPTRPSMSATDGSRATPSATRMAFGFSSFTESRSGPCSTGRPTWNLVVVAAVDPANTQTARLQRLPRRRPARQGACQIRSVSTVLLVGRDEPGIRLSGLVGFRASTYA